MWKPEHRRAANRHGLRYPSDLSDSERALIEPSIPPAKRGGRRREVNAREVLNAIFYVLSTGCQWQALLKDLPLKSTAHSYLLSRAAAQLLPSRSRSMLSARRSYCAAMSNSCCRIVSPVILSAVDRTICARALY
jgi:transposase